jgi:hypothetical protein
MRVIALLVVGTLVACGGEVAPDDAGKTTSPQSAGDAPKDVVRTAPPVTTDEPSRASGGTSSGSSDSSAYVEYSETACWSYGQAVDGECEVGQMQYCDGYVDATSSSGGTAPFCKQICVNQNGKAVWSAKSYDKQCAFFDSKWHVDKAGCSCDDYWQWENNRQAQSSSTPLVLSFDDAPVTFTTHAGGAFDLVADGACHGGDWPSAATPWLALDRNGNGTIDDGGELFGSAVVLADGTRAKNGFDALRELDANRDGIFDASDEAFAKVVVWTDRNGDRRSTPNELASLADAGVKSIALDDHVERRCDARGNCEGERSLFTMTTGRRGAVIDVYVKTR